MPTKKSGNEKTRKSPIPAAEPDPSKSLEPEIIVQNPPKSPEREHALPENLLAITDDEETPFTIIEEHLYTVLLELQTLHDKACKTNAAEITMKRTTFTKIATRTQQAWEQLKTVQGAHEEGIILKSLKHIQASIAGLEQKYEDIQAKVTENNTEMACKLNEIQATTTRLENKHEAIERTVKEAPKTYADIIKASTINTKEKAIAEMRARQRQQRDALRQERAKYEVTLTMKETNDEVKELINTMPPKEITERCQHAVEKASISGIKLQGINKLANGIRVRCATEEQAGQLRVIDWGEVFKGIKIHEPNYGIVINGVPIDELDLDDSKTIKLLEAANNFPSGTISKVTFLRRKDKEPSTKTKHRSIVIYFNNYHTANKCITNGCYINYLLLSTRTICPTIPGNAMLQLLRVWSSCCKLQTKPRCGKCAGKHNTKECNSTTVQCVHCKDSHEAWRHECPAWIAEKYRLEELRDRCPDLFTV